jgi:hypothetical protein
LSTKTLEINCQVIFNEHATICLFLYVWAQLPYCYIYNYKMGIFLFKKKSYYVMANDIKEKAFGSNYESRSLLNLHKPFSVHTLL